MLAKRLDALPCGPEKPLQGPIRRVPASHLPRASVSRWRASENVRRYDWTASSGSVVGNDPVNMVDPSGKCTGSIIQKDDGTCAGGGYVQGSGFCAGSCFVRETVSVTKGVSGAIGAAKDAVGRAPSNALDNIAAGLKDATDAVVPDAVWESERSKDGLSGKVIHYNYDLARNAALRWLRVETQSQPECHSGSEAYG